MNAVSFIITNINYLKLRFKIEGIIFKNYKYFLVTQLFSIKSIIVTEADSRPFQFKGHQLFMFAERKYHNITQYKHYQYMDLETHIFHKIYY